MRLVGPILAVLGALIASGLASAQVEPDAEIRTLFANYQQAMRTQNGAAAVRLVTQTSLDNYGRFRDAALHSSKDELEALPLYEQLMVLNLRLSFTAQELSETNAAGIFQRGVSEAWAQSATADENELKDLVLLGARAQGRLGSGSEETTIWFLEEGGAWKVDLAASADAVERRLQAFARANNLPNEAVIAGMLGASYGQPLPEDLWLPLLR